MDEPLFCISNIRKSSFFQSISVGLHGEVTDSGSLLNVRFWSIFVCLYSLFSYTSPSANMYRFNSKYFIFYFLPGHRWFIYSMGGLDLSLLVFTQSKQASKCLNSEASTSWPQSFSRKDLGACNAVSHLTVPLPYCIQAFSTCHNPPTIML